MARLGRAGLFLPPGWARAPWIAALAGAEAVLIEPEARAGGGLDAVVIGPDRNAAARGRAFARRFGLPVIRLDDRVLGPCAPARLAVPPIAVLAVPDGLDLAAALAAAGRAVTADLHARAAALLPFVLAERLLAPEAGARGRPPAAGHGRRVLIEDAADDGGAAAGALDGLWRRLLDRHPPAALGLVVPPAFPRGEGRGLVLDRARALGVAVVADDGRPDLLDGVEAVWSAGGRLGLEARLAGRAVIGPDGPVAPAEPAALAAALLLVLARYADPSGGGALAPEAGLARLADLRRRFAGRREAMVGYGFSRQKARTALTFLAGWDNPVAFAGGRAVAEARRRGARLVAWGMRGGEALARAAEAAGVPLARLEDGFIRSVGLGTAQTVPASLALDDLGLYYDARHPSRLERIAAETAFAPDLVARARALRERLVATRVTKYNLPAERLDFSGPAGGRRIVLVIGQVPDDAAIRYGTVAVTGNLALLAAVRRDRPDAFIVYKEHPDLVTRSRAGWLDERLIRAHADLALRRGDAIAAIEAADEVHTLTSLAGFEALIRMKPVVTWGIPFYAGWGLTEDRAATPRRGRRLALDELVAAALILYPAYVDPVSRLPCEVEDVVGRIEAIRAGRLAVAPATRFRRLVRASVVAEAWIRHLADHRWRPR